MVHWVKVKMLRELQSATEDELSALMPSILHQAFKGEVFMYDEMQKKLRDGLRILEEASEEDRDRLGLALSQSVSASSFPKRPRTWGWKSRMRAARSPLEEGRFPGKIHFLLRELNFGLNSL